MHESRLGVLVSVAAPELVELATLAGFDTVILDAEHGALGPRELGMLVIAARSRQARSWIRVARLDPQLIGLALDLGADAVLVPQIGSAEQARAAVAAARFAPQGARGANPWVRAGDWSGSPEWYAEANNLAEVHLMIEGQGGFDALDDILTSGCTGVFVGPVDLSHAVGLPGQIDHPHVIGAVQSVLHDSAEAGVRTGVFAGSAIAARRWAQAGADLVALGTDAMWALSGMRSAVAEFRQP